MQSLILGTWQFGGRRWGKDAPSRDKSLEILDFAINNQITRFDTADAYGSGLSNHLLRCLDYPNIYIQSKVGYRWISDTEAILDLSSDNIISSLSQTFELFGSNLQAIMLHDVCADHSVNINAIKIISDFCKHRIDHFVSIGISNSYDRLLQDSLDAGIPLAFTQNEFNLLQTTQADHIQFCHSLGIDTQVYSPTARGLLAGKYDIWNIPCFDDFDNRKEYFLQLSTDWQTTYSAIYQISLDLGASMMEVVLSIYGSIDCINHLVIGVKSSSQLNDYITVNEINLESHPLYAKLVEYIKN